MSCLVGRKGEGWDGTSVGRPEVDDLVTQYVVPAMNLLV